mmetsp:Transcript_4813/g.6490  ORF Transcript_4813/g.6490 Transcript_4813/m.6490 type:complete len:165 (-) Transcript_4813:1409-1903(-)
MFTELGEKMGLWSILAPRKKKETDQQIMQDEALARKLQREEEKKERERRQKEREEKYQQNLEKEAEEKGMFVKKQFVIYHHKASKKKYYSQVVGVHFDDGPDRPYYTIKYERNEEISEEGGNVRMCIEVVEKQTTPDRLIRITRGDGRWEQMRELCNFPLNRDN